VATRHAVRFADDVILNKRDLYIPGHWEAFRSGITAANPYARLWETTHARVDIEELLTGHHPSPAVMKRDPAVVGSVTGLVSPRATHHPMVTTVRLEKPLHRDRFLNWVSGLPDGLERAKGYFRFIAEPELQEFQFSAPRTGTVQPVMLLDEPEHAIVLIGRGYDAAALKIALLRCLSERAGA
jgi:G3E family GTPase